MNKKKAWYKREQPELETIFLPLRSLFTAERGRIENRSTESKSIQNRVIIQAYLHRRTPTNSSIVSLTIHRQENNTIETSPNLGVPGRTWVWWSGNPLILTSTQLEAFWYTICCMIDEETGESKESERFREKFYVRIKKDKKYTLSIRTQLA